MPLDSTTAVVTPWYRQFYLRRGEADWASDQVSEAGYERGLDAIDGFVYVGTTMFGNPTEVSVEVHESHPEPSDEADRVVEVPLAGSGSLAILSWGSSEPEATVELPEGPCRLRASWYGMADAEQHPDYDLGGADLSPERVLVEIWPAPDAPAAVLVSAQTS